MSIQAVTDWREALREADACTDAIEFAKGFDNFQAAWDACERGDWMLWWIRKQMTQGPMHHERRPLVKVCCQCARLALPFVRKDETRPLAAIELAERWATGDDSVTQVMLDAADAYAASASAAAAAAAAAADAAYAYAADASAAAAAYAYAYASAADAAAAAAAAARLKILKQCADLVRASYPHPPQEEAV